MDALPELVERGHARRPVDFRAHALEMALARLDGTRRHEVLDLGAACEANVGFFSGYRCRVHIADLWADRSAESGPGEEAGRQTVAALAFVPSAVRFDLVLSWDLLQYLDEAQATRLVEAIRARCAPEAMLHAAVFTGERLGAHPGTARIRAANRVGFTPAAEPGGLNPCRGAAQFGRRLTGFRLRHSFLAAGAMQEYLFVT